MRYRIVTVQLLVPDDNTSVKKLLSNCHKRYPKTIMAWSIRSTDYSTDHMEQAEREWESKTGKPVYLGEPTGPVFDLGDPVNPANEYRRYLREHPKMASWESNDDVNTRLGDSLKLSHWGSFGTILHVHMRWANRDW